MRIFDRNAKLREGLRRGRLTTGQKEILSLLRGRLQKNDVPSVVVEPADAGEVQAALQFAAEKQMKVAVAAGLGQVEVRNLEGGMLLLTTRLAGAPTFAASRRSVRVDAGVPVDALQIDFNRAGLRWLPLFPVPAKATLGELIAQGWEGLRSWRDGGTAAHVEAVEWMDYAGRLHRAGSAGGTDSAVDTLGFVFGSRGTLGVILAVELSVMPVPPARTAVLYELPDANTALQLLAMLRQEQPLPESVVYWGEVATDILRQANDGTIADQTRIVVVAEWREAIRPPESRAAFARIVTDDPSIDALWQDLLRLPRAAARLFPERTAARVRLPAGGVVELEEAARELGRDANLPVALWGTVEAGHFHVWVLRPDDQPRTARVAEDLLKRVLEVATELGGRCAQGTLLPFDTRMVSGGRGSLSDTVREQLLKRCDPQGMHAPLG